MGNGSPRNPASFIYLMPGVQEGGTFGFINGGQSFSKDVYIEGLPITDAVRQGESRALQFAVSVESVEQFQVETSGQSVEFNGQGSENYTIKSGTNQFHGSLYEYFRNTKLDARSFFSPTRPQQNQNQYGFTFGGPIKRNKLFFFGAYDGYRYRVATDYRFVTIPTMRMRTGDFGELPVADLRSGDYKLPGGANCTRQPFPEQRHSGQPHLIGLEVFPGTDAARQPRGNRQQLPQQQHGRRIQQPQHQRQSGLQCHATRIASPCCSRAARMTRAVPSAAIRFRFPCLTSSRAWSRKFPPSGQLKHTWVINSAMMNQISYGASRLWIPITNPTIDGNWVEKAGIKGLPQGDATQSFPEVAFAGPNAPQGWRGTDARPFLDALNNFSLQDNFQWLEAEARHQGRVPALSGCRTTIAPAGTARYSSRNFSNSQTAGFNNGTLQNNTGNAYASYLLGTLARQRSTRIRW